MKLGKCTLQWYSYRRKLDCGVSIHYQSPTAPGDTSPINHKTQQIEIEATVVNALLRDIQAQARLEEKYQLDDPTIRLLLPGWELFSATGKKLLNWLRSHKDIANNLWRMQLLKIAQQSHHPHCPTCTCGKSPQPPMKLLDLDDIQALLVIKLNPMQSLYS